MPKDTAVSVVAVDGHGLQPHSGSGAPEVKATYAESLSTTLKAIVGSGITALPFAFKEAGWMAASIGLTCIALASAYTMRQVIVCVQLLRARIDAAQDWQRMESDNLGYSQLGAELFGRAGRIWVDAVLISCQVGSSCAFVVFVADCIHSVLPVSVAAWLHVSLLIALLFPLLCALALPRNTTYLAPTSHLGNISLVVGVTTVMVYGFRNQTVSFDNTIEYRGLSGLATFFGICVFTFSAHAEVTSIEQFADDRPAYKQIVVMSVLASGAIYFAFGLLCYMFFGEATDSIIFLNLPPASVFVSVVKCALAFVVLSNYPLAMFPATEALDILLVPVDTVPAPGGGTASLDDDEPFPAPLLPADLAGSSSGASALHAHSSANGATAYGVAANGSGAAGSGGGVVGVAADETTPLNPTPGRLRLGFNRRKGNLMRICAVAFTCLVAALLPNFGYITALVGSVSNGMLAFVLPPVFYLQLHRLPPPRTVGPVAYAPPRIGAFEYGFNVLLAVVGTIATLGSGALIAIYGTGAP